MNREERRAAYVASLKHDLETGELTQEWYEYHLNLDARCYLCKRTLAGGSWEIGETDERIGFEPELAHVKEMLDNVIPKDPKETFAQGADVPPGNYMDGKAAIVCMDCLDEIVRGTGAKS